MTKGVYADNAATTKISTVALQAMQKCAEEYYGNPSSLHSLGVKAKRVREEARERIAAVIGAKKMEIFFTSGGTESDNWALQGRAFCYPSGKKHLVTSQIEHHAILKTAKFLQELGYEVSYLPVDDKGHVEPTALEHAITTDTILASVMLANNEIGTIEPIRELAYIAHKHHVPFHTDAVQAVGHIPLSVDNLGVDMLSASAHKFHGPRGIGFLYVREGTPLMPLHHGGSQEYGLRAGTENLPAIMGMTVALEESCKQMDYTKEYLTGLEQIILKGLRKNNIDYRLNGGQERLPGLLSLSFRGQEGERILHRLDLAGISVSTGSACNSHRTEVSHVLKAISLDAAYAKGTIRISLSRDNDTEAAKKILAALLSDAGRFWGQ